MRQPIYKGCTRPPLLWGVPLLPLMAIGTPSLIIFFIGLAYALPLAIVALLVFVGSFAFMREVTKRDDHRLVQLLRMMPLRAKNKNRRYWGCVSYCPVNYKRRKKNDIT